MTTSEYKAAIEEAVYKALPAADEVVDRKTGDSNPLLLRLVRHRADEVRKQIVKAILSATGEWVESEVIGRDVVSGRGTVNGARYTTDEDVVINQVKSQQRDKVKGLVE